MPRVLRWLWRSEYGRASLLNAVISAARSDEVDWHIPYAFRGSSGVSRRMRLPGQERDPESCGEVERERQLQQSRRGCQRWQLAWRAGCGQHCGHVEPVKRRYHGFSPTVLPTSVPEMPSVKPDLSSTVTCSSGRGRPVKPVLQAISQDRSPELWQVGGMCLWIGPNPSFCSRSSQTAISKGV